MKSYKNIFLCILSAALLIFSFPSANLSFLAWIALIPFILVMRVQNSVNAIFLGFLTGIVFFYGTLYWLNYIAFIATIALVLYLALYFSGFAFFTRLFIRSDFPIVIKAVLIGSVWVVFEFIRANFVSGFSWVSLGYSQAGFLSVIQLSDITGAYGVSFLLVFVNVLIVEFFFHTDEIVDIDKKNVTKALINNKLLNLIFSLFLILGVFVYGYYRLLSEPKKSDTEIYKISVVQGNIVQLFRMGKTVRKSILEKYLNLTKEAVAAGNPDLVVWPEISFPEDLEIEPEFSGPVFDLVKNRGIYLLMGANRFKRTDIYEFENIYNSSFLISPKGNIEAYYDKMHLVPFGEYSMEDKIPKILFRILPKKVSMVAGYTPGKDYTVFKAFYDKNKSLNFSTLICFEDTFPQLSRSFVKKGARLLVNMTNDGWFGKTGAPFQHAQASVFRAVENRVPVVRSANTGLSIFINEKGKVFDGIKEGNGWKVFKDGYKTAVLTINSSRSNTFYCVYGDVFVGICFLFSIIGSIAVSKKINQAKLRK